MIFSEVSFHRFGLTFIAFLTFQKFDRAMFLSISCDTHVSYVKMMLSLGETGQQCLANTVVCFLIISNAQ